MSTEEEDGDSKFEPFYNMITKRRDEALRSVLIALNERTEKQVVSFLRSLKGVEHNFFYGLREMRQVCVVLYDKKAFASNVLLFILLYSVLLLLLVS